LAATIIDGKAIAAAVQAELKHAVDQLRQQGRVPGLAVVLIGDDPASQVYVTNKGKTANELGMHSVVIRRPADMTQQELLSLIGELNRDESVHGILVQSPLPKHLDEQAAFRTIDPRKDVDGFHPENVGRLWLGRDTLYPCTPAGVMVLLQRIGVDPAGKRAVVVGRSNIVGKPMAALLLKAHATVTLCHSRTADLKAVCREAEILVAAIGKLEFLTGDYIRPGAVVIDVGINPVPGYRTRIRGDVHFASAQEVAGMITPVPGGVGPLTIAMLMSNTVKAARQIWGLQP
jgi:methylenetetrahydrofolate dehydrogenase (NADP+) / methenyltetrahydrofolate cyclohydrolase